MTVLISGAKSNTDEGVSYYWHNTTHEQSDVMRVEDRAMDHKVDVGLPVRSEKQRPVMDKFDGRKL